MLSRVGLLALRGAVAAPVRLLLLSVLIALSILVFLVVNELSRLSADGLDEAIAKDAGESGTYVVSLESGFGRSQEELLASLEATAAQFSAQPAVFGEVLPGIPSDCPPFSALGSPNFMILRTLDMTPVALPFGSGLPVDTTLCYSGQVVPSSAAYLPNKLEQGIWGPVLFLDPAYRDIVALASSDPVSYQLRIITGTTEDMTEDIRSAVEFHLFGDVEVSELDSIAPPVVMRRDSGPEVREASEAIRSVYAVIGWGVLLLGGLAILVSELIVVRGRSWFFGLARSMGAQSRHIAMLIVTDVLLLLCVGASLALVVAFAGESVVSAYTMRAFGVEATLVNGDVIPRLVAGGGLVLLVGAVVPVMSGLRNDPLDVLEAGREA